MKSFYSAAIVTLGVLGALQSQAGSSTKNDTPEWLSGAVRAAGFTVTNSKVKVGVFRYKGNLVYHVPAGACCDLMSTVYSSSGEVVCRPSGGFTGLGDSKCPDFESEATMLRSVLLVPKDSATKSNSSKAK